MPTTICLYEDHAWRNFLPLVYMRPVFALICGSQSLLSRVERLGRCRPALSVREGIGPLVAEQMARPVNEAADGPTLYLNGRALWFAMPTVFPGDGSWVGLNDEGDVVCVFADGALAPRLSPGHFLDGELLLRTIAGLPRRVLSDCCRLLEWPWELVHQNKGMLVRDLADHDLMGRHLGLVDRGSHLLAPRDIHIGDGTRVKPCVVIDAEDGPVWIGENVRIMPHSYIQGPVYIGDGCILQVGANIREGTHLGPVCKVGGEVEESIVQGYSNKQHDGFLGHSYVGSWVNIAADCINSDLKNTYGRIRVPINGEEVDTGELFQGALIGDHAKVGINVSIPTGAVIGFCSNVYTPVSPKFVPSFSWIVGEEAQEYDAERAYQVAEKVLARRKKGFGPAEAECFRAVLAESRGVERQRVSA